MSTGVGDQLTLLRMRTQPGHLFRCRCGRWLHYLSWPPWMFPNDGAVAHQIMHGLEDIGLHGGLDQRLSRPDCRAFTPSKASPDVGHQVLDLDGKLVTLDDGCDGAAGGVASTTQTGTCRCSSILNGSDLIFVACVSCHANGEQIADSLIEEDFRRTRESEQQSTRPRGAAVPRARSCAPRRSYRGDGAGGRWQSGHFPCFRSSRTAPADRTSLNAWRGRQNSGRRSRRPVRRDPKAGCGVSRSHYRHFGPDIPLISME